MERSREVISISSLEMSKRREVQLSLDSDIEDMTDKKLKMTVSFLSSNFCEKSITLKIRISIFCSVVKI